MILLRDKSIIAKLQRPLCHGMVISMGLDLPHGIPHSPIWGPGHVQSCHLMTLTLHTRWTLLSFCLHSHRNEVLGGPRLSIMVGLQLFASLWPDFNSRAYKLSLNSMQLNPPPFLSLSVDKCSSAVFPRHGRPYLLLHTIQAGFWASCSFSDRSVMSHNEIASEDLLAH